ncbi:MAG: AAA family ATPase [Anaerolineae bacterium]|nr:AAA family ATPase [Anaerolineae bacterium]
MDLFTHGRAAQIQQESPLANRMRPRTLDEYVGQAHILGPGRLLRRAIQADQLSSLIFYGPPGTGKTTLAMVIANSTRSHFITINAVLAGVKEIREAIETAQERRNLYGQRTTLFVDEVHRWNKAQQDALLPWVENGTIILIGATTENPYFEVNKALVSRSRIFQLKPLTEEDLTQIARQALADEERGYGRLPVHIDDDALAHLVDVANGDARGVLNALELAVETTEVGGDGEPEAASGRLHITLEVAEESIQRRAVLYDKEGDVHYDTISAFIKSVRGSDPDAAMYWLAKMDYAGEDPRFLFRRMAILAGEDIGMADPNAITVVLSCWQAFERIGLPEGRFPLALAALYLSTAPKSNSAFAFFDARGSVEKEQEAEVPNHLRDANRDKEGFGHGAGYLYPHAYRDHWVAQQYLPAALQGKLFYQPSDQGYEQRIREQVARRREEQIAGMLEIGDWRLEMGEIYTTSPTNRARDAWLQRTISNSGRNLGQQRDRLFELAGVQRHHLILDINAGSGLLTWEAVRRAPEGGVWALTADLQAGDALRQMAEKLAEMERPSILIGPFSELDYLLGLRGETDLRFDRILARNLFTDYGLRMTDYEEIEKLRDWLLPDGRLCLIQTVPRRGQRLYRLVEWGGQAKLRDKVTAAEETIYHDESDPLVNWDEADVQTALTAVGFTHIHAQLETETSQRQITEAHLGRWFGEGEGERLGYGRRLQAGGLTKKETSQVETIYRQQLLGRVVEWSTAVTFILAALKQS